MKLKAFTIAELLIVLGIIGIVAETTIPTLIGNSKKEATGIAIKKFYSTMTNAIIISEEENGDSIHWEVNKFSDPMIFWNEYLAKYISVLKIQTNIHKVYLKDGTTVTLRNGSCIDFEFDVNGDKKPNVTNRDRFYFLFCGEHDRSHFSNTKKTFGAYSEDPTREKALARCQLSKVQYVEGGGCTGLVLIDNFEFKDDYP